MEEGQKDNIDTSDEIINPFNGSCKVVYEQVAGAVLNFTPKYTSFQKPELDEESLGKLKNFFLQYKRRFFDGRCLSRPIYTFDHDKEGNIVYDDNNVPILLCHTYSKGALKCTKRLLYKEAVNGILQNLHYAKGVDGQPTCLPGGINALSKMFNDKFVFKGNFNIIKSFLASCSSCKLNKPLPTTTLPPPVAIRTFKPHSRLQCDLIDMAPKKRRNFMQNNRWGYRYILTVKCCFSKFCWLFPLKNKTADEVYSVLNALFHKEGSPTILQSDNGGEFIGGVVKRMASEMNIKLVHGRPYHPQSQGQIENLNKQVKKCLARFLQRLTPEMQANVWPILLSGIADYLNSQWHSTIDDVPFRVYKNREPVCQTSHIVVDDDLWMASGEDGCLDDYEFLDDDMNTIDADISRDNNTMSSLAEKVVLVSAETILSSCLGIASNLAMKDLASILHESHSVLPVSSDQDSSTQAEEVDLDFKVDNFNKMLGHVNEAFRFKLLDVLEATEHTIHKNHKRSLKRAKEREFRVNDKVLFRKQGKNGIFSKSDPFQPLNNIGVIQKILPGGMYIVQTEDESEVMLKSLYSGEMVLLEGSKSAVQCASPDGEQTLPENPTKLSLLTVHNAISEFGLTMRKEIYDKGLKNTKKIPSDIDSKFKSLCLALDYGLLAMLCSLSGKERERAIFHQKFSSGLESLEKEGFRYFLYGTVYWERERKQHLSESILIYLIDDQKHSSCLDCLQKPKKEPCNHACCQHLAFQFAVNSGLLKKTDDSSAHYSITSSTTTNGQVRAAPVTGTSPASSKPHSIQQVRAAPVTGTPPVSSKPPSIQQVKAAPVTRAPPVSGKPASSKPPSSKPPSIQQVRAAPVTGTLPASCTASLIAPHSLEVLKEMSYRKLDAIEEDCQELSEFVIPFRAIISDLDKADASTASDVLQYLVKIIGNHAPESTQSQLKLSRKGRSQDIMHVQGYSSFCGLCALNNAIGGSQPLFNTTDLDVAADIMWLKQVTEIGCGLSLLPEPMRCLDGDYSIMAMEKAAMMKNIGFVRLDAPLISLLDGTALNSLDDSSVREFYSLLLQLFDEDQRHALIVRTKKYHYVTLLLEQNEVILYDSRKNAPVHLTPKAGLIYLQSESFKNGDFAAVSLLKHGARENPIVLDDFSNDEAATNFSCTLEEIWDSSSTIHDQVTISTLYGDVTAKDLRSLKPDARINDVVVDYIGQFLMSQRKNVYIAGTFWLEACTQGRVSEMKHCNFNAYGKFIFPVHCSGHWWCVVIDKVSRFYGEFDSLCPNRSSPYVFQVLSGLFHNAGIDLSSFRKLNNLERKKVPSQGQNMTECGVFLLSFMTSFTLGLSMNFHLPCTKSMRHSYAQIILNGRPSAPSDPTGHLDHILSSAKKTSERCQENTLCEQEPDPGQDMDDHLFQPPPPLPPISPIKNGEDCSGRQNIIEDSDEETDLYELLMPPQEADEHVLVPHEMQTVLVGLNFVSQRYIHELEKTTNKCFIKGRYHAAMTRENMDDFDDWRMMMKGRLRGRSTFVKFDKALQTWLRESASEEQVDEKTVIQRVDKDGWVQLNNTEFNLYDLWRSFRWSTIQGLNNRL